MVPVEPVSRGHIINLRTCTQMLKHHPWKWVMSTQMHACTQWEAAFWRMLATIRGFSSLHCRPLARPGLERGHILQGVSKQRWHVDVLAPLSAPYHRISHPCQKSNRSCFLSRLFFFFSFPPNSSPLPEKTESLFVLMVVPFLSFILT